VFGFELKLSIFDFWSFSYPSLWRSQL